VSGRPTRSSALADPGVLYYYGSAFQYAQADGARGSFTVAKPNLTFGENSHSLAELAVESSDGLEVIEVGYTVDRALNVDNFPHLFVFHWVNGVPTCYNACGFVRVGTGVGPRSPLKTGAVHQFMIEHVAGNWWIGQNGNWFGYYPDTLWGNAFTKVGLVQWFGEVAATSTTPCTDMGNGEFAAASAATSITNVGYFGGPPVNLFEFQPTPSYYTVSVDGQNNLRFGGPGAC
jgi:hypothetical protein